MIWLDWSSNGSKNMIGVIGWFLTLRSSCERLGGLYTLHPSKKDLGCLTSTRSLRFLHSAGLSSALSGALLGRVHLLAPFLVHFWGGSTFWRPFWCTFGGGSTFWRPFWCTFGGGSTFRRTFWCTFWGGPTFWCTFGCFFFAFFCGAGKKVALLVAFFSHFFRSFFVFFFFFFRFFSLFLEKSKKSEKRAKKKRPKVRLFSRHH